MTINAKLNTIVEHRAVTIIARAYKMSDVRDPNAIDSFRYILHSVTVPCDVVVGRTNTRLPDVGPEAKQEERGLMLP